MTDTAIVPPVLHRIEVPRSARYATMGGTAHIESLWVVLHGFGMLAENFIKCVITSYSIHYTKLYENVADTEVMRGILGRAGFATTDSPENADVIP